MGTENAAEAQKKAPKRHNVSDDEDLALLGYPIPHANNAVAIKPPSTRPPRPFKVHTGGHRPMNTLSTSSTLPTHTQFSRPRETQNRPQMLVVDVSRGNNVPRNQADEADENLHTYQSAKRQKIGHVHSGSSISSESVDELPAESVRYGGQARKSSVTSRGSQVPAVSIGTQSRVILAHEFGGVEDMMDSSRRSARSKKQSRLRNASSPFTNLMSKANPVEVDSDNDQMPTTRGSHGGRFDKSQRTQQLKLPHHSGTNDERKSQTKTRSPYFPSNSGLPIASPDEEKMSTKFVASNGSRRGHQDHLSSDELDGPPTIGQHADVMPLSPDLHRPSVSPKKIASLFKSNGTSSEEQPVEPSNIKPTVFRSHTPNKGKEIRQEDFDNEYLNKEKSSWAVPLAAVNLPGQKLHVSSNMKLVYNKDDTIYLVIENDTPLRVAGSRLEIYPRSLQKIWWANNGKKVRFESSKRGTVDHVLDLELGSEKDLSSLIKRLQLESTNVRVVSEESEKMQRRFEVRRKQQIRPGKPSIPGFEDMDEGAQMAALNQQRNQNQALASQQTSNTSRRRTGALDSLAQKMKGDHNTAEESQNDLSKNRQNNHPDPANLGSADEPIGHTSILSKFQPAHNDHLNLRRSTRTSGSVTKHFDPSPERQQVRAKRFSVEFGLGERWSKPLSYPKVGKKKTTVEWDDLERLDEDEFLNDNLVSFYMRYLEQEFTEKTPELARTVYFFNSFFYDRLNSTQKGQRGINYEGVQRWTRGVDLFAYDYIIVPINELAHWYVAIICNLPALGQSGDPPKDPSSPIDSAIVEQTTTGDAVVIEENISEPHEKQARQSFAELSLDGNRQERQPSEDSLMGQVEAKLAEPANDADEDHEMLDVPIAANKRIDPKPADLENPELVEDTDEGPKPSASARKQKPKSLLPTITKRDPASPVILTFDSFGHPHSNVIKVLKQYLYEEGNAKKNIEFDVGKIKGITAKNIPQQKNFSDCGLYMLGYVEKFLDDHPKDFIGKIIKREYDDRKDWPKMVPSTMRKNLREQLQRLHAEDEAERIAIRNAKRASGSRDTEITAPLIEKDSKYHPENASNVQANAKEDAPIAPEKLETDKEPPSIVQQLRNAVYYPSSTTKDEKGRTPLETSKTPNVAEPISESNPDDSLILIGSHDHTEPTNKLSQPEIPSSQPPHPPTYNTDIRPTSPSLPTEIEDSQPQQPQIQNNDRPTLSQPQNNRPGSNKDPEDFALSPGPFNSNQPEEEDGHVPMVFEEEEQKRKNELEPQDMVYTSWRPTADDTSGTNATLPSDTRPGKRGVAQRVQPPSKRQQQVQGKKMKKEDAIVLDD